ncbi:MAG: hypothetical protein H8D45_04215 [Bacteroidetes bacterium]|nr:hypothetical protein [Bacteroidota bacterium]
MKLYKTQIKFLEDLYERYKQNPTAFVNIQNCLKGMKDTQSVLEFGSKMKDKGFIDGKYLKRSQVFSAKITMKGIEVICEDIKELTLYILEELMEEGNNLSLTEIVSFRMLENLKDRTKLYFRALDLAEHLKGKNLIEYRLVKKNIGFNEIIISITPKGVNYYLNNGGKVKEQHRIKNLKKKTSTGWKYKFEKGKYVDDPIISSYGEFDEHGNHTKQVFYNDDSSIRMQFDVDYDENNKPVSGVVYMPGNTDQEKLFTKFEAQGNITTQTAFSAEGFVVYKQVLEYDENKNLLKKKWLSADDKVTSKEMYKYNKEGKCTREIMTSTEGKIETLYDEYGMKKESLGMDSDGRIIRNYTYTIDRYGNMDEEIRYDMFGKPMYLVKFMYDYY